MLVNVAVFSMSEPPKQSVMMNEAGKDQEFLFQFKLHYDETTKKKKMECLDQILILIVQWCNAIWMDEDVTEIQKDKRSALQPFYLYGHPVKKKTA